MALTQYRKKRSFNETPEPEGGKSVGNDLKFVIQKHEASHLHYDFRLEMEGVLKSWAVPKGPSSDPAVKRLAMMVEDHPYDYKDFEGIIPKGQYGGGTVIVWDNGNYVPADMQPGESKASMDKRLRAGIKAGKLHIIMNGKKMQGEYALVKTHGRGENAWLLFKVKDQYASKTDLTKKDKSVLSGKTIRQMEKDPVETYGVKSKKQKGKEQEAKDPAPTKKTVSKKATAVEKKTASRSAAISVEIKVTKKIAPSRSAGISVKKKLGKAAAFPKAIAPMLASLVPEPFDSPGWIYEIKWDGYRTIAKLNNGNAELLSRNAKSFDEKFYSIKNALEALNVNCVLDGEIIVADEEGKANFGQLQNWRSEADGTLQFYVFDLLWYDGKDLMNEPLSERRKLLKEIIPFNDQILLSQDFDVRGTEFFEVAEKAGLEGIMAKKADSTYSPGARSKDWLKIKTAQRHEVVIGGFTKNDGTAKSFSSLLVGVYDKGQLKYTGKIGTGFNAAQQKEMMTQFKPLIVKTSPFEELPDINKPSRFRPNPPNATAFFLKPELVCEVSYTEMTSDGVMRHPSFEGMRIDKPAKSVHADKVIAVPKGTEKPAKGKGQKAKGSAILKKGLRTNDNRQRTTLVNPSENDQVKKVNGHELKFSNLSKVYWPDEKYTKRDMINYYYQIAPFILPYLKDRPQSLNRFPNGINGPSFYQKDVTGKVPDWIEKHPYTTDGEKKNFMLCNDDAALLYMASLGAIEMNPWNSTVKAPDNPTWCAIDLDPDKNDFDQVIETALVTKQILDAAGCDCYCKTSGSTGIHIYIPLGAKYDYEQSKEFARLIATLVHDQLPKFTSIERATKLRKGKLYIDFLQNRPGATLAAAYSLRPKPGATVSMPLHWEEVKKGLKMSDYNIKNAVARAREVGDIFKLVLGKGINLKAVLKKLGEL